MEIHGAGNVSGPDPIQPANRLRSTYPSTPTGPAATGDSVEISELARLKARLEQVPDIRMDRVESLRKQIEAGTYETEEKFSEVVDRLLEDLG